MTAPPVRVKRSRAERNRAIKSLLMGLLFISPWIIGFLAFQVYPFIMSAYYSFTEFSGFGEPLWVGLDNYKQMFTADPLFYKSLYNTFYYTALAVPIGVVAALLLATAMNQNLKEIALYRVIFYLPSILPLFAVSFIFLLLLNPRYGLFNWIIGLFGLGPINWIGDPNWSKFSLVLLAQLGAGQAALIFLAAMKGVPLSLYEAADIDGASGWQKFRHITLPLITPVILYDLITGLNSGLQVFTTAFIVTGSGATDSTLFYVYNLYNQAFKYSSMGYASALSWVLFFISLLLAGLVFWSSKRWVRYEASA